jgi:hypothetical protein
VTLGIGIINTTQFILVSVYLSLFGTIAVEKGFSYSRTITGLIAILLLPLLALVAPTRGGIPSKEEQLSETSLPR